MLKKIVALVLFFFSVWCHGQDMQQGFDYLNTGKYKEATVFFEQILEAYPENKTAKLCYGRAIGLSGNTEEAVHVFTALRETYPEDLEIQLNYAESLLWSKAFEKAVPFYEKILEQAPENFAAVLGYANTLSNLKKYPEALKFVNRALELQPENANALVSRKYIRLGYADALAKKKEYEPAIALLDENLVDNPKDKDSPLKKAEIYLITNKLLQAEEVYVSLQTNKTAADSIISFNGLSLVVFKAKKPKLALDYSVKAIEKVGAFPKSAPLYLATQERYVQALLWNKKYKEAFATIKILQETFPEENRILGLLATAHLYTGNFDKSTTAYENLLNKQANSFDGNLGIANAHRANSLDKKSYQAIFQTLKYYPQQPDAEQLLGKLKQTHTPWVQQQSAYTFDNGNNQSFSTGWQLQLPVTTTTIFKGNYGIRKTENTITESSATTNEFTLGISQKISSKWSLSAQVGTVTANLTSQNFDALTADVALQIKPYKLQNLTIGYQRQLQNFNADLVAQQLLMDNYSLNYNLSTNVNVGFYLQYIYTQQSDANRRNLLFTSLYCTLAQRPILKVGLNYQTLSFKEQFPTLYFSPASFHVVEGFTEIVSPATTKWIYGASAAVGYQFIEDDAPSTTFRVEGKLGRQISKRFQAKIYARHSNVASANAAGFQFTELGFILKWYFLRQPIFNKKIEGWRNVKE